MAAYCAAKHGLLGLARVVRDVYRLSGRSVVEEILIRPQRGDL